MDGVIENDIRFAAECLDAIRPGQAGKKQEAALSC